MSNESAMMRCPFSRASEATEAVPVAVSIPMRARLHQTILCLAAQPFLYALATTARRLGPVVRVPGVGVVVSDAAIARDLLRRDDLFTKSGERSFADTVSEMFGPNAWTNIDGEAHRRLRATLMPLVTPERSRRIAADSLRLATYDADRALRSGSSVDLVRVARTVAGLSTSRLVGLEPDARTPHESAEELVETAHQLSTLLRLQGLTRASRRRMARPASRLEGILRRAYARDPLGETVIARLVSNGVGYADARGTLSMLVLAGTITTAAAIPRMVALLIDSDAMRLLREDSSRIPAAVDGALRLLAPLPLTMRFAAEATRLGGVGLRAGERILVLTMNVTRDPLVVPEPNVMMLGSRPVAGSQRSWYGDGAHFCLGFALAQEQLSGVLRWLVGLPGTPAIVRRRPAFDTLLPRYDRLDLALHSSTRRAPR